MNKDAFSELVKAEGPSYREFSEKSGMSPVTICKLVTGRQKDIKVSTLKKLCETFDKEPKELW